MTTAMTNVKNVEKLNNKELELNLSGTPQSWHYLYRNSAWIFVGGLSNRMTEGDVIIVFSQYGEVVNINLIRDKITGQSKGYCFLCYEDQRSTILAVENLNNIKIDSRTLRVDHVEAYKVPELKESQAQIDLKRELQLRGCAPDVVDEIRELEKKKRELEAALKKTEDEEVDLSARDTNDRDRSRSHSDSRSRHKDKRQRRDSNGGRFDESSKTRKFDSDRRQDQDRSFKSSGRNFSSRNRKYSGGEASSYSHSRDRDRFDYSRKRSASGDEPSSKFISKAPRFSGNSHRPNFSSRGRFPNRQSTWSSGHQSHNMKREHVPKVSDYREIIERYRAGLARRGMSGSSDKYGYKRTSRS